MLLTFSRFSHPPSSFPLGKTATEDYLVWFGFLFQTNFLATLQNCYAAREMYHRTTEPAWDVTPTDRATIVDYGGRA